VVETFQFV